MTSDLDQYIRDTEFVEKLVRISLIENEDFLTKNANVWGSVSDEIQSAFKSRTDFSSPDGITKTVLSFLTSGVIFKISPVLGIINEAAGAIFGMNLQTAILHIYDVIKSKVQQGIAITGQEVNQAAKSLAPSVASDDLFKEFRKVAEEKGIYHFTKNAQPIGGTIIPDRSKSFWTRIFWQAKDRGIGRFFIVALAAWVVKTTLLAAGLLAVGSVAKGVVKGLVGVSPTKPEDIEQGESLKPSKPGGDSRTGFFSAPSTSGSFWIIDLDYRTPKNYLLDITIDKHQELSGYEGIVSRTPTFQSVKSYMRESWIPGYDTLAGPPNFSSEDEVADKIYQEAKPKIPSGEQ